MSDKTNPDLEKPILSDAEFTRLVEQDFAKRPTVVDDLSKQRMWNRLETSMKKKTGAKWKPALAVIAALALAVIFIPFLPQNNLSLVDDNNFKGTEGAGQKLELLIEKNEDSRLNLHFAKALEGSFALALFSDQPPHAVLWQGESKDWKSTVMIPSGNFERICLIQAEDSKILLSKIEIIREIGQLPADTPCFPITL